MSDTAQTVNMHRLYSQLPDQLPFRNEDADLFNFLDGLGTDHTQQNNGVGAAAARGKRANFFKSFPSWGLPPSEDPQANTSGVPAVGLRPGEAAGNPLSSLPLPDVPLGGLPLGEDNLFMSSLGTSTQPAYPYQHMPRELQPSTSPMRSPQATQDMPSLPMWTQAPMSHDDFGGFVPVSSGQSAAIVSCNSTANFDKVHAVHSSFVSSSDVLMHGFSF